MPTTLEKQDILFSCKPGGVSSHRPSDAHVGFVEWLEDQSSSSLKICHRLDKETSGAMVFGKTKEAAAQLTELFTQREVSKEYLFVSDKKSQFDHWVVVDSKAKGTQLFECPWQEEGVGYDSFTEFHRIGDEGTLYLYKALPKTGKTHQVRKHATHSETPILGDSEYGGGPFPRLMLHCHSLKFMWDNEELQWSAQPSILFSDLSLCKDPQLASWITAFERRKVLFPELWEGHESLRLAHIETEDLRAEKVGGQLVLGWWKKTPPSSGEKDKIKHLMKLFGFKKWIFTWRPGAQTEKSNTEILRSEDSPQEQWTFTENNIHYLASLDRGQNFGLFLDQRDRRLWLKNQAKDKRILNLFAFTSGFSLNAALGGAKEVVTVDIYQKYLNWGKENFALNDLDPEAEPFRWYKMDSQEYLKFAKKKSLQFDLIVCDPPSFSRTKKPVGVFRLEKDFGALIKLCVEVLAPHGVLLFSTNFEAWDLEKWTAEVSQELSQWGRFKVSTSPSQWDFEWQKFVAGLKSFFIQRA